MKTTREQLEKQVVEPTLDSIQTLFKTKGNEYAIKSAFHNFYQAVKQGRGVDNPMQALEGMKLKHDVSFRDLLNYYDEHYKDFIEEGYDPTMKINTPTKEYIDEKINDILVYTILQKGLLYELYGYIQENTALEEKFTGETESK